MVIVFGRVNSGIRVCMVYWFCELVWERRGTKIVLQRK
jgi:hypothetical protein